MSENEEPDELEAADHADEQADIQRRMGEEYGSVPLMDPSQWPEPPSEWPQAPKDRANDSSRVPDSLSSLDFLAASGFSPEDQAGVTGRAGRPAPTFTWGENTFDRTPCADCSGSQRVHDDTCVKHPKRTAIEAVEDPDQGFKNLYTDEGK